MKIRFLVIPLLAVILAAPFASPAQAQDDPCFNKGGTTNPETGACEIGATIEVKIAYPLELVPYDFATAVIDEFIKFRRTEFLQPIVDNFYPSPSGMLALQMDYELFSFSDTVISLLYTVYDYTGGAHGMTTFQTYVFDLAGERVLTLNDIFQPGIDPLATVQPLARQILETQLTELGGMAPDATWLDQGTAPIPENYANWVLTPDALVFYFPPYQVAAYALGPQIVSIPLADLSAALNPEFSLAG